MLNQLKKLKSDYQAHPKTMLNAAFVGVMLVVIAANLTAQLLT